MKAENLSFLPFANQEAHACNLVHGCLTSGNITSLDILPNLCTYWEIGSYFPKGLEHHLILPTLLLE